MRVLVVAAHPDDETLAAGGLIARLVRDGSMLTIVFATDGSEGLVRWRRGVLMIPAMASLLRDLRRRLVSAEGGFPFRVVLRWTRREMAIRACHELGVPRENLVFLRIPEDTFGEKSRFLSRRLQDEVANAEPDLVIFPASDDGHPDHREVHDIVAEVLRGSNARGVCYRVYGSAGSLAVSIDGVQKERARAISHYRGLAFVDGAWQSYASRSHEIFEEFDGRG